MQIVLKWLRSGFRKTVSSIAFIPAIIASLFLILSYVMIAFDFSPAGKQIKSNLHWLSLKDASTARSICSSIVGGIISLAVFSFSMVMILLNQAASQMSNRILGKLIGNRFQQIVLGFYIGTIVYALFLLSTIRDINTGIYVPAISTYLLIALTIFDIFLFIYFLHYITETVKFETIIENISKNTMQALTHDCKLKAEQVIAANKPAGIGIGADTSGLFQGFDQGKLLTLCEKHDLILHVLYPVGTYLIKAVPLIIVTGTVPIPDEVKKNIQFLINIEKGQEISTSYYYGFRQLMELAVRALSPGINDPGTAVLGLHALGSLLAFRLTHFPVTMLEDKQEQVRIFKKEKSFQEIFDECVKPIWDYGKNDRLVRNEMFWMLTQLNSIRKEPVITRFLATTFADHEKRS